MNLFRPALKHRFFDVVISNGVLHHTSDCRLGFRSIGGLVKPGGFLVVGLYSAYSRKVHAARRAIVRATGIIGPWLDPHFGAIGADGKREAWFQDQYHHPHETTHTLDETLGWLDENGFDYVNSIPKPVPGTVIGPCERLFDRRDAGTSMSRLLSQLADMRSGYREGGFFIVIGQRRADEPSRSPGGDPTRTQ
jgi:SAM-dependent methyltransferase